MGFYDVEGASGPQFGAGVLIRRVLLGVIVVMVAVGVFIFNKRQQVAPPPAPPPVADLAPPGASLLPGLSGYSMPIESQHPEVQKWFDQGLMLAYGFNHDAAERSFLKATELDADCAMCWWGAALVLGPHVNAAMDPKNNEKALERVQKASTLAAKSPTHEQAYIRALSARYSKEAPTDRAPMDKAYASAMGEVVKQFPNDLDAATLHAESLMNLQPWDYWDAKQKPKGRILEIVAQLESVMKRNPDHPGALHLYVHAVEASNDPQRGVDVADRLRDLVPGSGHLVHMPAHIYTRVGRYNDAVVANEKAIQADDVYLATCRPAPGVYPLGYVPHNHHFLWWAASMQGSSVKALSAAEETAKRSWNPELMRLPDLIALQDFWVTPLKAKVQFAKWNEIAEVPAPEKDLLYPTGIWHFAQGMSATYRGDADGAEDHLESLAKIAADPQFEKLFVGPQHPLSATLRISEKVLAGSLAQAQKNYPEAIKTLEQGVALEDAVAYFEPPLWHQPVRQKLGVVLMAAGKHSAAEKIYREDLRRNPDNGVSLYGLQQALLAQNRDQEASAISERLERAWEHADVLPSTLLF